MKLKTKYLLAATVAAALIIASVAMLVPAKHVEDEISADEKSDDMAYGFAWDLSAGDYANAEKHALGLPISDKALRRLHIMLFNLKKGEETNDDAALAALITSEPGKMMSNYTIAEIENAAAELYTAKTENDERSVNAAKKAANGVLGSSIKFKVGELSPPWNSIPLECENMYLEVTGGVISFLSYTCAPAERRLSTGECAERAGKFILKCLPGRRSANGLTYESLGEFAGCESFIFTLGGDQIWIKVRYDTGKVTFFDGYELYN